MTPARPSLGQQHNQLQVVSTGFGPVRFAPEWFTWGRLHPTVARSRPSLVCRRNFRPWGDFSQQWPELVQILSVVAHAHHAFSIVGPWRRNDDNSGARNDQSCLAWVESVSDLKLRLRRGTWCYQRCCSLHSEWEDALCGRDFGPIFRTPGLRILCRGAPELRHPLVLCLKCAQPADASCRSLASTSIHFPKVPKSAPSNMWDGFGEI